MLTSAPTWFPVVNDAHTRLDLLNQVLENEFEFNGETFQCGSVIDWSFNPSSDPEWLIALHKFYYAVSLGMAWWQSGDTRYVHKFIHLVESWIEHVALDSFPNDVTGRRVQNWISAWYYFQSATEIGVGFRRKFFSSLEAQIEWLIAHLTPARNHRTLELTAIFFAGVALPELPGAGRWLEFARDAIVDNIGRDFRPDGVHCEQSTYYHHVVLRNALIVKRLAMANDIAMPPEFDEALRRALEFSLYIHRPDGLIPALSDADSASFLATLEQANKLYPDNRYRWVASGGRQGCPPDSATAAFQDAGYYIWRSGWGTVSCFEDERFLVFDCGPLGEGNHGHFDLLSFELYGYGMPLIVDPGRYTYSDRGELNWRALFRGTGYHNTVIVDSRNQTRYGSRRRKPSGPPPAFQMSEFGPSSDAFIMKGRAQSFEYDVVHEREIRIQDDGNRFIIIDELESSSPHEYQQLFHLSPSAREAKLSIRNVNLDAIASIDEGWISTTYGVKQAAPVLSFSVRGQAIRLETHIEVRP